MTSPKGYAPSTPLSWLLAGADVALIYLAFVGAFKIRLGAWTFDFVAGPLGTAFGITLAVYLVALILSGLYRMRPTAMHLDAFLKVAAALMIAWAASVTLTYLVAPDRIPPRSVTATQCVFTMVGVLGLRATVRYLLETRHPAAHGAPAVRAAAGVVPVRIEDVLERTPVEVDRTALRDYFASRTVLVTGAGGSIGSELASQLMALNPFRMVLVDVSEYNLFQLEQLLRPLPYEGELDFRIADVRDEGLMQTLFATLRPDVVLHAAAYKHVPLMERHPVEAFRNNTMTTVGLLRLCERFDAEQFVFVSTDKAVAPTSVLGATKRLAEWYVRSVTGPMHCKTVRFGNVFGSVGSVVPTFVDQIAAGGPVTVTHPEMERYFMSAQEACALILQTLLLDAAPVYTLKMGEAVRIGWLAEELVRRLSPHRHVAVEYSGLRPGEKLNEQLWGEHETPVATEHDRIVGVKGAAQFSRSELDDYFRHLHRLCTQNRTAELRKALFQTELRSIEHPTES